MGLLSLSPVDECELQKAIIAVNERFSLLTGVSQDAGIRASLSTTKHHNNQLKDSWPHQNSKKIPEPVSTNRPFHHLNETRSNWKHRQQCRLKLWRHALFTYAPQKAELPRSEAALFLSDASWKFVDAQQLQPIRKVLFPTLTVREYGNERL